MRFFVFNDNKQYWKVDMFKIVQQLVPNWYFVVVALAQHKVVAHNLVVTH